MGNPVEWKLIETGWYVADDIGSVRSQDYRSGGWWFLPHWLPDQSENDVGPFVTLHEACSKAESLYQLHGVILGAYHG